MSDNEKFWLYFWLIVLGAILITSAESVIKRHIESKNEKQFDPIAQRIKEIGNCNIFNKETLIAIALAGSTNTPSTLEK